MSAGLLSTRQSRLQAAHEVTAARLRIREHDERLLALRAEIAALVSPGAVREMLERRGDDEPLTPVAGRSRTLEHPAPAIGEQYWGRGDAPARPGGAAWPAADEGDASAR